MKGRACLRTYGIFGTAVLVFELLRTYVVLQSRKLRTTSHGYAVLVYFVPDPPAATRISDDGPIP